MSIRTGRGDMKIVLRVKDDGTAVIEKFGDTTEKTAQKSSKAFDNFSAGSGISLKSVATYAGLAAAAIVGIGTATIKAAIEAAAEAERIEGTLNAVLRATQHTAGLTSQELIALADSMARVVGFDDESIKRAMTVLLTFPSIGRDVFQQAIQLSADLAVVMGTDLTGAVQQVGRALNDPVEGLGALSRAGIRFSATQQEMISKLHESGRVADAQKIVLRELQNRIGGAAAGENSGVTGATRDLTKSWNELLETMGRTPSIKAGATATLTSLAGILQALDESIKESNRSFEERIGLAQRAPRRIGPAPENNLLGSISGKSLKEVQEIMDAADASYSARLQREKDLQEEATKKRREDLAKQLKDLHENAASEMQLRAEQYVRNWQSLQEMYTVKLISQERYQAESEGLAEQYEIKMAELQAQAEPESNLSETLAKEREQRLAGLQGRLADLQANLQSERQIEDDAYAQRIAALYEANQTRVQIDEEGKTAQLLSDQEFQRMREEAKKDHEKKITDIEEAEIRKRYGISTVYRKLDWESAGFFASKMAVLMQTKSEALFKIGKVAAIAEIIVNQRKAAMGAYAALASIPYVGPFLGAAAAAAAIAFGVAQIQAVNSQQIGGGTGATGTFSANPNTGLPTSGAPDASAPLLSPQQQTPTTTVQITIQGNVLGNEEFVRETLIPVMRAEINGRDVVFINSNSRQAQELVA